MSLDDKSVADLLKRADEALLHDGSRPLIDANTIRARSARRSRSRRVQSIAALFLGISTLVCSAIPRHREKPPETVATVAKPELPLVPHREMPAFEPPIELELERESVAVIFLNRALRLRKANQNPDEEKAALDFIVQTFPTTVSADYARRLLLNPNMTSIEPGETL